jgi:hypothetical protein
MLPGQNDAFCNNTKISGPFMIVVTEFDCTWTFRGISYFFLIYLYREFSRKPAGIPRNHTRASARQISH